MVIMAVARHLLVMAPACMILAPQSGQNGFSIIETTIAAGISAIFLASLFSMNSASTQTLKIAHEAACASQILQQRMESLRIANWQQITDANWLKMNMLNTDAPGAGMLKAENESLTLIPYGSTTPGNTQLTRTYGSPATIVNDNNLIPAENALKSFGR